jgi:hypothetical protein
VEVTDVLLKFCSIRGACSVKSCRLINQAQGDDKDDWQIKVTREPSGEVEELMMGYIPIGPIRR